MADFVFNIAKGKIAYYGGLPAANDALIAVPIETAGIESDAVLKDYATLSALLAGPSNEQTTMGRIILTNVAAAVDNVNDLAKVTSSNILWPAATGNQISAIVICYVPDTTVNLDTNIIPLTKHDFAATPNGSDISAVISASGIASAA